MPFYHNDNYSGPAEWMTPEYREKQRKNQGPGPGMAMPLLLLVVSHLALGLILVCFFFFTGGQASPESQEVVKTILITGFVLLVIVLFWMLSFIGLIVVGVYALIRHDRETKGKRHAQDNNSRSRAS